MTGVALLWFSVGAILGTFVFAEWLIVQILRHAPEEAAGMLLGKVLGAWAKRGNVALGYCPCGGGVCITCGSCESNAHSSVLRRLYKDGPDGTRIRDPDGAAMCFTVGRPELAEEERIEHDEPE